MIAQLFEAGADVFRINMSHTTREDLAERVAAIRSVEEKYGRPIGILVDLQGPKLRIGTFEDGAAMLNQSDRFVLDDNDKPGNAKRVYLPHPEILAALEPGHTLLIDDGKIKLVCESVGKGKATTRVVVGGKISNRKGVSLPDTVIPVSAMTPKDRSDLEAAVNIGVDWIALSFVQRPEDLAEVRKVTRGQALVMAKIEKPQAVARLDEIIEASDGLMVARGDLGVEMPLERVPGIQKLITSAARAQGKPVVVATQMLESMITAPVPTRAEVSDVATAVFDGADAVMLSAESASGQYPVQAVATMNRIAEEIEADVSYNAIIHSQRTEPEATAADAIANAARSIAETLGLKAVIAWTSSGATGIRISRERPLTTVLSLTPNLEAARRLAIAWGVHAFVTEDARNIDDMTDRACRIAHQEGFAEIGQRIIVVAGIPFGRPGATNTIRIAYITPQEAGA
jgi:pyruvate kinase